MSDTLEVRAGQSIVGRVRVDASERFSFAYDRTWLTRGTQFPVSITLPLTAEEYVGGPAHTFFSNLLPEGAVRQAVCARLGISPDNDFALLQAIGGECAGALSLVDPTQPYEQPHHAEYEVLEKKRLQALVADDPISLLVGGATTRLSLAGAQDKLPVTVIGGKLHLALRSGPSTHILKLPNRRYPHLPANEAFALGFARHLGFEVVEAELFTRTVPPSLLVTRYDRVRDEEASPVRRLHQEDLCQATALPPTRKYEAEGGPSFLRVATVIRDHVYRPLVDVRRLIEWQIYNLVIGNSDGHAKNLSILYGETGEVQLAPFYDLVSTRDYKALDRKMAMTVGGRHNPDEIGRAEWIELSRTLEISERVVFDFVRSVAQRSLDRMPGWKQAFREAHGEQAVLQTLPAATMKRARRILRSLDA